MIFLDSTLVKDTIRREVGKAFNGKEGGYNLIYEFPYGTGAQPIRELLNPRMKMETSYIMPGGIRVKVIWSNFHVLSPMFPVNYSYYDITATAHIEEFEEGEPTLEEAYAWCKKLNRWGLYWLGDEENQREVLTALGHKDDVIQAFKQIRRARSSADFDLLQQAGLDKFIGASYVSISENGLKSYTADEIKDIYRRRDVYTDITDDEMCTERWWINGEY